MHVPRTNQSKIHHSFDQPFITALLGPRRVGKSTLVREYAQKHESNAWVFLNMDHLDARQRIENGALKDLIQEGIQRQIGTRPKIWVAIDEAQKCPVLFDQIKALYDQYKDTDTLKFILTGSGFLTLHQLSAESLAGRIELHYLREFSLRESACYAHAVEFPASSLFDRLCDSDPQAHLAQHVASLAPFKPLLNASLEEEMLWGGLPEVLGLQKGDARRAYLANYLQAYLEKDIRALTTITDLNLYHKLMDIIAEQTGSVRQDKTISEALGCSRDTLKKYRGFLSATLVYQEVYPYIGSVLKRLVKTPKGYLLNNGLISYLTGLEELPVLQKSGLIGHRFENWFLKELQIWLDRESKRSAIYYWRTSGGAEVDFVVQRKPGVFPFEVTYSSRVQDKKIKNLRRFMQEESKAQIGFYVYMGDYNYDAKERICFLPAWAVG